MTQTHYSDFIKDAYATKRQRKTNYSLRAFARNLHVDPAQLSRVLARKGNLSFQKAQEVSEKIFTTSMERTCFLAYFELATAKTPYSIDKAQAKLKKINSKKFREKMIEEDTLKFISNWYYIAILDLCHLPKFETTIAHFSQYLKISEIEVEAALSRLMRLGLLYYENGRYYKEDKVLSTTNNIPSSSIKKLHHEFISKALASLDTQSIDERQMSAKTMTIKRSSLPKFKKLINQFMSDVSQLTEEDDQEHDSLYQLNVQLFNLRSCHQ